MPWHVHSAYRTEQCSHVKAICVSINAILSLGNCVLEYYIRTNGVCELSYIVSKAIRGSESLLALHATKQSHHLWMPQNLYYRGNCPRAGRSGGLYKGWCHKAFLQIHLTKVVSNKRECNLVEKWAKMSSSFGWTRFWQNVPVSLASMTIQCEPWGWWDKPDKLSPCLSKGGVGLKQ